MAAPTSSFYQLGASLPVDAPSYVKRLADEEFYQKLKAGKFCYVLNSRQMGKSSLRVQTMQRLQASGTVCAAIDLTGIGKHKVTLAQWYGGIVYALVESCQLEDKFDFDWQTWWQKHQEVFDPVTCLRLLIEKILLVKIEQQIVIFVDEIDRVLSQNFSVDDFFALIRFFQNQRVDNPAFERLTFALLGVATPSDLITDKTQTPFNIGEAIELHGFQIDEVEPLIQGLRSRFRDPQAVMKEILDWTGGQPFLTQKLCQFMVEESEKENPRAVEEVVRSRIIENWESLDEPEHLRTIRDRILSREQRASYLLELYQQIRISNKREVIADNTLEQSELQLSGLVVRQQNKLRVYNPIYKDVFDQTWIETQLRNLRPYSENFKFWVASGGSDDSRLLRGKALQDALSWAKDKSLNYQDRQFLAASQAKEREEEIAALEKEAALERERKDREATEKRNQVLTEANNKAQQRISIGTVVLILTLVITAILGTLAGRKMEQTKQEIQNVSQLSALGGELYKVHKQPEAEQAWKQASLSFEIRDLRLKQAMLLSNISIAYQQLGKLTEANKAVSDSFKLLRTDVDKKNSADRLVILAQALNTKGHLLASQGNTQEALSAHTEAFNSLQSLGSDLTSINPAIQVSFGETVKYVYRGLIGSLLQSRETVSNQQNLKKALQIIESLQLTEINNFRQLAPLNANLREIDKIDSKAAVIYPVILLDRVEVFVSLPSSSTKQNQNQDLRHYTKILPQNEVEQTLYKLRQKLEISSTPAEFLVPSQKVYDWIIQPIESELEKRQIQNLVFVLDDPMRSIPMAALHDGKMYLVEKYNIALTPGLELLNPQPLVSTQLRAIAGGLSEASENFPALPAVKRELLEISSILPSKLLLNQEFTLENLKEQLNTTRFPILHLATHGQFSSKAENTFLLTFDGRVKVNELTDLLKSSEIELLVLSNASTAAGDNRAALGIARVAVQSGARSVIASLWVVDDQATADMMGEFYKQLSKPNTTKAEALRKAQLSLLKNPLYDHPYYWAPLVLVGNWL